MKRGWILLFACLAGILAGTVLAGKNLAGSNQGSVSVAFSGFTNNPAGAAVAQFTFSNGYSWHMGFAAAKVQVRQANGWPQSWILTNGPAYDVAPGMTQNFAVVLPDVEGAAWRVPIIYDKIGTKFDSWVYQAKSIVGLPHVSEPFSTNTAVMVGLSDPQGGANGKQPLSSDRNSSSAPAASGRSP